MSYSPFTENFDYSKKWTNPQDFPTYEAEETQVREDMQCLYDEIATALNTVTAALKAASAAGYVGVTGAGNFSSATTLQAALAALSDAIDSITAGTFPDNSVTTAKIVDEAVTTDKIDDAAVTTDKIDDAAVTTDKIDDAAVTTDKIDDGAVTPAKCGFSAGSTLTIESKIKLGANDYGDTLPTTGNFEGRLFFLKVSS